MHSLSNIYKYLSSRRVHDIIKLHVYHWRLKGICVFRPAASYHVITFNGGSNVFSSLGKKYPAFRRCISGRVGRNICLWGDRCNISTLQQLFLLSLSQTKNTILCLGNLFSFLTPESTLNILQWRTEKKNMVRQRTVNPFGIVFKNLVQFL